MKKIVLILIFVAGLGTSIYSQSDECTIAMCGITVTCSDYPKILTYAEALSKCPSGYRLPTIDELLCLAQNKSTLHLRDLGEYWSVTTIGSKAYTVTMDDGKGEKCEQDEKKWVRYIKDKQNANHEALNQLFQAANKPSNRNYALLHFYRPGMMYASGVWFDVYLEGQEVWRAKNGRRKTIKITKEGSITLREKNKGGATITFDVELGKEYYVEFLIGYDARTGGYPVIRLKDESVGHSMFNRIKAEKDDTE